LSFQIEASQTALQNARQDHSKEMERASARLEQLSSEVAALAAERDNYLEQVTLSPNYPIDVCNSVSNGK
jgi:hypothetical protein